MSTIEISHISKPDRLNAPFILCGASPKQIAKWAGHSSVSVVLDRYGHLFPDSGDKPMAEMDRMFRAAKDT